MLVSDGASAAAVKALRSAVKAEGMLMEVVAPTIAGATLDDGTTVAGDQMVGGGPSVLYDAVAVIVSEDGAAALAAVPPAKDFVADAHAHAKFVAYTPEAAALFGAAGVTELDGGYVDLQAGLGQAVRRGLPGRALLGSSRLSTGPPPGRPPTIRCRRRPGRWPVPPPTT